MRADGADEADVRAWQLKRRMDAAHCGALGESDDSDAQEAALNQALDAAGSDAFDSVSCTGSESSEDNACAARPLTPPQAGLSSAASQTSARLCEAAGAQADPPSFSKVRTRTTL